MILRKDHSLLLHGKIFAIGVRQYENILNVLLFRFVIECGE